MFKFARAIFRVLYLLHFLHNQSFLVYGKNLLPCGSRALSHSLERCWLSRRLGWLRQILKLLNLPKRQSLKMLPWFFPTICLAYGCSIEMAMCQEHLG